MIQREILNDPDVIKALCDFDYYNDYKDTDRFLKSIWINTAHEEERKRISLLIEGLQFFYKMWLKSEGLK